MMANKTSKLFGRFLQDLFPTTVAQADIKEYSRLRGRILQVPLEEMTEAVRQYEDLHCALIIALASGCPVESGGQTLRLKRYGRGYDPQRGDRDLVIDNQGF
jgi:hypothetical protein